MITITCEVDKNCKMARVNDSVGNGMEGNFWDFHPGCHGITKFGFFRGFRLFVQALKKYHEQNGESVEIIRSEYDSRYWLTKE